MEKKEHNQVNDVINLEKSELYMAEIYNIIDDKEKISQYEKKYCKNRSKPDNDARVRPDAKTEFNRTVKRCSTGH